MLAASIPPVIARRANWRPGICPPSGVLRAGIGRYTQAAVALARVVLCILTPAADHLRSLPPSLADLPSCSFLGCQRSSLPAISDACPLPPIRRAIAAIRNGHGRRRNAAIPGNGPRRELDSMLVSFPNHA